MSNDLLLLNFSFAKKHSPLMQSLLLLRTPPSQADDKSMTDTSRVTSDPN